MRAGTAVVLLALCLCGASVRATGDTKPIADAVQNMLKGAFANIGKGPAAALAQSAGTVKESAISQYATISKQLEEQINTYESNFCTPGKFTPGSKKPAAFVGHSFTLTFDSGSCYFNETNYIVNGVKELNCTEPSITYATAPANFTSSYHAAATFQSQYCQISKAFGEPLEKVLYTFDGQYSDGDVIDVNSLAEKITTEVQNVLQSMTSGVESMTSTLWSGLSGVGSAFGASTGAKAT